eukprot:1159946-Pyramimonas_sp.AAC.1
MWKAAVGVRDKAAAAWEELPPAHRNLILALALMAYLALTYLALTLTSLVPKMQHVLVPQEAHLVELAPMPEEPKTKEELCPPPCFNIQGEGPWGDRLIGPPWEYAHASCV